MTSTCCIVIWNWLRWITWIMIGWIKQVGNRLSNRHIHWMLPVEVNVLHIMPELLILTRELIWVIKAISVTLTVPVLMCVWRMILNYQPRLPVMRVNPIRSIQKEPALNCTGWVEVRKNQTIVLCIICPTICLGVWLYRMRTGKIRNIGWDL